MRGFESGAGEKAHHFIKKSVAGKKKTKSFRAGFGVGARDGAVVIGVGRFVATKGGEGLKIMPTLEKGESFVEKRGIELARKMPYATRQKRRQNRSGGKFVAVGFFASVKAGMKIGRDFLTGHDADGGGKVAIERRNPVVWVEREVFRGVKMGDLAQRVDAGIGATRGVQADFFFGHSREGGFDSLLNGVSIGLDLPAGEKGAVVGDGEFETHEKVIRRARE